MNSFFNKYFWIKLENIFYKNLDQCFKIKFYKEINIKLGDKLFEW